MWKKSKPDWTTTVSTCSSVMFRFFPHFLYPVILKYLLSLFPSFSWAIFLERLYFQVFFEKWIDIYSYLWIWMRRHLISLTKPSWGVQFLFISCICSFPLFPHIFFFHISATKKSAWLNIPCNSQSKIEFHLINILPISFILIF